MALCLNTNIDSMVSQAELTISKKTAPNNVTSSLSDIKEADLAVETTAFSLSDIKEADLAVETTAFASASVLQQAGIAVLAQANQQPDELLVLLPRQRNKEITGSE